MSTIAILGSGRVAKVLAAGLGAAGHEIVIGSRDPEAVGAAWEGPPVSVVSVEEAAANAPIVINATPGDSALGRLSGLREQLAGTILVDVSNATEREPSGAPGGLMYPNSSLAEHLQDALPDTRVVKTLNTMLFMVMAAPGSLAHPPTAFLSGDDAEAKATVTGLLADLGWNPDHVLDLGDIRTARGPEALILLVPGILTARGMVPFGIGVTA